MVEANLGRDQVVLENSLNLFSAFTSAREFPDSSPLASLFVEHGLPGKSGWWWEGPEPSWRAFHWGWDLTVDN